MAAVPDNHDIDHEKAIADALFLSIGEGSIVTDSEGAVSRVNQAALDILGVKQEDLLGKWYPGTVVAEDSSGNQIPFLERPIAEVFMSGKTVFRKLYYRKPDGSRVAVALTVSPVLLDGAPVGAIEVFRDITQELMLEKAKDEFIALASHQLRTPATGVKQYLGMLQEGYVGELTDDQRKYVDIAMESNERQLHIINNLLKVAAADTGNLVLLKQKVNLVTLIKSVLADQASRFESKEQPVTFTPKSSEIYAEIDENTMRMVLDNIIDNAHKYTYPGKGIDISIQRQNRSIIIAIKDEGTGIKKSDFPKLFQKFSRLDNPLSISSGGTGLGLYWVKQVVDLHGGSISVESRPKRGSTFTITLPDATTKSSSRPKAEKILAKNATAP